MLEPSRTQLVVYAALAVVGLLLGARWIRAQEDSQPAGEATFAAPGAAPEDAASGVTIENAGGDLVVHVAGAVARPGVYRLPAGSRVADALERAGGARNATLDAINLAARLADGQQVVVPERVRASVAPSTAGAAAEPAVDAPISLGTATVEQLDTIEGIGPVTAQDIVEFRDAHGGLSSIDQLDEISGIGPATMEALRSRLQP